MAAIQVAAIAIIIIALPILPKLPDRFGPLRLNGVLAASDFFSPFKEVVG
jgi:hypothetical protein